jgi:hypothetical protein
MRKPRPEAKLKTLPEEMQERILEYARTHSTRATAKWLSDQGIVANKNAATNKNIVIKFLAWHRTKDQLARNESVVLAALEAAQKQDRRLTPKKVRELGQKLFSGLAMEQQNARVWSLVQQIELRVEKLQLDWKKFHEAVKARKELEREVKEVREAGGITPGTLEKIEAELKLL